MLIVLFDKEGFRGKKQMEADRGQNLVKVLGIENQLHGFSLQLLFRVRSSFSIPSCLITSFHNYR